MLVLENPTTLRFPELTAAEIDKLSFILSYIDKRVDHQIVRLKNNARQYGFYKSNSYEDQLAELQKARKKTLLFQDEAGYWTYSGLRSWLEKELSLETIISFDYPEPQLLPWAKKMPYDLRWYQKEAVAKLLEAKHGSVEIGTGLGKSSIIATLVKELALPAVIMAPTLSIANQLLKDCTYLFGAKKVGQFFGGKKKVKFITIAVSKSLTMVTPGSDLCKELQKAQVFICDESHLCPADTLTEVCLGLFSKVPYRFFLSGTQMRADGLEKVLTGIIGDIVIEMTVKQGVDQGFLSRPRFYMIETVSNSSYENVDAGKMTRIHCYKNPLIYEQAGKLASKMVNAGRRVLIMLDEVTQFPKLLNHLQHPCLFAHGPLTEMNREGVPQSYWKSDSMQQVADFDAGKVPILVGTSCIGIGTDIKSASAILDLMFGASETRVRQTVGRGTRLFPGKTDCLYFDWDVTNVPMLHRHAMARAQIHEDIYGPVTYMK